MPSEHKYARVEWERRFLLRDFPRELEVTQVRLILDRYIEGTRLRLRRIIEYDGNDVFKLTQKLPSEKPGARQGLITTLYLSRDEFEVFAKLPAKTLSKLRHSVPPFGVDVFEGPLQGVILAEAEFPSEEEAASLVLPSFIVGEVTADPRFTGGSLATATRDDLQRWLSEYAITLETRAPL